MVLSDPGNTMSSFALAQIDAAITLFASLIDNGGGTPRYRANLEWLKKLRARALESLQAAAAGPSPDYPQNINGVGEDEELVGWRTRLIERAGQSQYKSQTIRLSESPGSTRVLASSSGRQPHPHGNMMWDQGIAHSMAGSVGAGLNQDLSTNDLVRRFHEAAAQANMSSLPISGSPCCCKMLLMFLTIMRM
jgi:hypothetical protein